jgi:hypothetical protein
MGSETVQSRVCAAAAETVAAAVAAVAAWRVCWATDRHGVNELCFLRHNVWPRVHRGDSRVLASPKRCRRERVPPLRDQERVCKSAPRTR